MKAKNISYPYPVLGNDDDVEGKFDASFKHMLKRDNIILKSRFSLKNKTLERLIREKKAVYTVEVECPSTFYRKLFSTIETEADFVLSSTVVREHVSVGFFIRATETLAEYEITGCHADYEGFKFDVGPGDVLALGGYTSFIAEKDFDPMQPAVSSLIAIKQGNKDVGPMEIDYSQDKIFIKLSRKDHKNYSQIKGQVTIAGVLHSSIVLPVLADAIQLVLSEDEETQERHWFRRLEVILRHQGLEGEDPLISAQKVLHGPIERCLSGLVETAEADE
ncbi:MAG: hypothetical protein Q7S04_01450 [Candidatus Moranbacteria bacterium]|nr:hypothetical protein [Candidatus Moranbacteria bacterium]